MVQADNPVSKDMDCGVEIVQLRSRNAALEAELHVAHSKIIQLRRQLEMMGHGSRCMCPVATSDCTAQGDSQNNSSSASPRAISVNARASAPVMLPLASVVGTAAASSVPTANRRRRRRKDRAEPLAGQSRYWTPGEHKLFMDAMKMYGHKDLKNISAYVGTRNMTQVRTHAQKYFMKLMKEAKKFTHGEASVLPPASSEPQPSDTQDRQARDEVDSSSDATVVEEERRRPIEVRSVSEDCGVSLLSLVAQATCSV